MQVTQIADGIMTADIPKPTDQEMQNEYNYFLAEQMTKKLLDKGLISVDEFNKIMGKNRRWNRKIIPKLHENRLQSHCSGRISGSSRLRSCF